MRLPPTVNSGGRNLKKIIDIFRRIEWILLVIPMAFLICAIVVEVFQRALGIRGFAWLEEFSRYVFVFCTFLGASLAVESDGHAKMTAILVAVPKKASLIMTIIGNAFCAFVSGAVAYYGYLQVVKQAARGAMATALPIPMYIPYVPSPLSMLVSAIRYLCLAIKDIRVLAGKADKAEKGEDEK